MKLVSVRTVLLASTKVKVTAAFVHQASKERTVMKTSLTARRTLARHQLPASIYQADSTANVHSILPVMIAEKVSFSS